LDRMWRTFQPCYAITVSKIKLYRFAGLIKHDHGKDMAFWVTDKYRPKTAAQS
jgi:hypothetical protein